LAVSSCRTVSRTYPWFFPPGRPVSAYGRRFEAAALYYLLKPVNAERLARAVERLKSASATPLPNLPELLAKLSSELRRRPSFLQWLQVSQLRAPFPANVIVHAAEL